MTTHAEEGTLQALADGETPSADAALRLHFERCPPCAEQLEEQREAWTTFTGALELLDVPAPVERAHAAVRARSARHRVPARWQTRSGALRRAAILLLVAGGVLYAVVPGTALNAWAGGVWERVAAPTSPPAPVSLPPAPVEGGGRVAPGPAGVSVLPGPDGTDVVLADAPRTLRVRLRPGERIAVEVEGAGSALRFRTGRGRVELSGVAGAEVRVALPPVGASTVRVGDRIYLLQEGTEVSFPGPEAARVGREIVFRTGSR